MRQRNFRFILALATTAAATLSVCPLGSAHPSGATREAKTTIRVKAGEMYFKLSTKSVAKPGVVLFVVKNVGRLAHDFRINGKQTKLIQPSKSATLVASFKKAGKYPYKCTVRGHAAAGMKGVFTVR
jgi:uncharacterized cupredoxin-like copper-binding protein